MSDRIRILFATIAAGGGHVATATAMAEALERRFPGRFETRVSDFMFDLGLLREDRQHKRFWRWALEHPQLLRTGQRLLDAAPTLTRRAHRVMLRDFAAAAAERLAREPQDLIVANHGWLTVGLTRAQRRLGLRTPVLSFETEPLDASALWAEPRAERFVVPSDAARDDLVRLGVAPDRVDVVGYPVRQAFLDAPERSAARRSLGLPERFTVLVSLGGEGLASDPLAWLEPLLREDVQVVILTGRNPALKARLAPLARRHAGLRLQGYTQEIASFVAAADVVVGKAGPASVLEALAVGRPFVVTSFAGFNERAVARFVERHGVGAVAARPESAAAAVLRYRDPAAAARVAERAAALDLAGMTERLALYIAHYATHGRGDPAAVGAGLPDGAPRRAR